MYDRIAEAIVFNIGRRPGSNKYLLMEGIPEELASRLAQHWNNSLPPLRIGCKDDRLKFGSYGLGDESFTHFRNQSGRGICVVICPGYEVPDWQSISRFLNISVSDLLESSDDLNRLIAAEPAIRLSDDLVFIRQAIQTSKERYRPTVYQFAEFLQAISSGRRTREALPVLGAFRDVDDDGAMSAERMIENLRLSRACFEQRSQNLETIRKLAEKVFAITAGDGRSAATFMSLIGRGDVETLSYISFQEAQTIFDAQPVSFRDRALAELSEFRLSQPANRVNKSEFERLESATTQLGISTKRRAAADLLLEFDNANSQAVFSASTRRKLSAAQRPRSVSSSHNFVLEAVGDAISRLESPLTSIQVMSPSLSEAQTRTASVSALALACLQLWMRPLATLIFQARAVDIRGALDLSPRKILENHREAFGYLPDGSSGDSDVGLPTVLIRFKGTDQADSVDVRWKPSWDDVGILACALQFAERSSLYLSISGEPNCRGIARASIVREMQPEASATNLVVGIRRVADDVLDNGLLSKSLELWRATWFIQASAAREEPSIGFQQALAFSGGVKGSDGNIGLGLFAPVKAEWISQVLDESMRILHDVLDLNNDPERSYDLDGALYTLEALAALSSTHYPGFLKEPGADEFLLPVNESRFWSVYSRKYEPAADHFAVQSVQKVVKKLITLRPEVATHIKCIAYADTAASILVEVLVGLLSSKADDDEAELNPRKFDKAELFCIGGRPDSNTLGEAERRLGNANRSRLTIRYFDDTESLYRHLNVPRTSPCAHLALVTGLVSPGRRIETNTVEIQYPKLETDCLFVPRVWTRPGAHQRMLLMPPSCTVTMRTFMTLMAALDDGWASAEETARVPEIRVSNADLKHHLSTSHDLALWVATVDRYVSRDSLLRALGATVAILHQESRLSPSSPLALVISQKSGGSTDRGVWRSLVAANVIDSTVDPSLGTKLREVASQGYGVLALEAATSGTGINELVAHVVSFSLLGTAGTPWPLPPECRILLVSLDEYADWFPNGKRADFLAIAIDSQAKGLHVAVVEVKARRSNEIVAGSDAVEQIRATLRTSRYAVYADPSHVSCRLWLNRVAEAVYSVARETGFRLNQDEIVAIESFRDGSGRLEWAGFGLVYGPQIEPTERHLFESIFGDRVPIKVCTFKLDAELLEKSVGTNLIDLRTASIPNVILPSERVRRRPEAGVEPRARVDEDATPAEENEADSGLTRNDNIKAVSGAFEGLETEPILGWIVGSGRELRWSVSGKSAQLPNGHIEIWGSSGSGKTQFIKSLLYQISRSHASFTVLDFKNDYGEEFPSQVRSEFYDLWRSGVPFNPLALEATDSRSIESAIIEIRDTVKVATQAYMSMGHRQLDRLSTALRSIYSGRPQGTWPTLLDLDVQLDPELRAAVGDLTHHEMFREGPPLGAILGTDSIFSLSSIPGSGLTTVLAGGFILAAILFKIQGLQPVANTVKSIVVVDEAHRVSAFRAIDTMIREGRSKGLAVVLATQQPNDLPDVVGANAQTRICFRLPDGTMARAAARRLDPEDRDLPEKIRSLGVGEAFVTLGGGSPYQVRMAQLYRDESALEV